MYGGYDVDCVNRKVVQLPFWYQTVLIDNLSETIE